MTKTTVPAEINPATPTPVSVQPPTPPATPKSKRKSSAKQLEQLAAARAKRKSYSTERKHKKIVRGRSPERAAEDYVKRVKAADDEATSSRPSKKRKTSSLTEFAKPKEFVFGAATLAG